MICQGNFNSCSLIFDKMSGLPCRTFSGTVNRSFAKVEAGITNRGNLSITIIFSPWESFSASLLRESH